MSCDGDAGSNEALGPTDPDYAEFPQFRARIYLALQFSSLNSPELTSNMIPISTRLDKSLAYQYCLIPAESFEAISVLSRPIRADEMAW